MIHRIPKFLHAHRL